MRRASSRLLIRPVSHLKVIALIIYPAYARFFADAWPALDPRAGVTRLPIPSQSLAKLDLKIARPTRGRPHSPMS